VLDKDIKIFDDDDDYYRRRQLNFVFLVFLENKPGLKLNRVEVEHWNDISN
jgi:hypothetical protein